MGLTMHKKRAVTKELTRRYNRANKKTKTAIVNQVIELAGYNRSYATRLLRFSSRCVLLPQANAPALRVIAADSPVGLLRTLPGFISFL